MDVFRRGLVAVLAMAALAVSACGGAQSSQPSKNQTVSVTMAQSIVTLSNAGVYVAIEKGYWFRGLKKSGSDAAQPQPTTSYVSTLPDEASPEPAPGPEVSAATGSGVQPSGAN